MVEIFPNSKLGMCEWPVTVATIYAAYCLSEYVYLASFLALSTVAQVLAWTEFGMISWVLLLCGHVLLWNAVFKSPFDHLGKVFRQQVAVTLTMSASCVAFVLGGLELDIVSVFVIMTYLSFIVSWALWAKQENGKKFALFILGSTIAHVIQIFCRLIPSTPLPERIVTIPPLFWYSLVVFYLGFEAIDVQKISEQAVV